MPLPAHGRRGVRAPFVRRVVVDVVAGGHEEVGLERQHRGQPREAQFPVGTGVGAPGVVVEVVVVHAGDDGEARLGCRTGARHAWRRTGRLRSPYAPDRGRRRRGSGTRFPASVRPPSPSRCGRSPPMRRATPSRSARRSRGRSAISNRATPSTPGRSPSTHPSFEVRRVCRMTDVLVTSPAISPCPLVIAISTGGAAHAASAAAATSAEIDRLLIADLLPRAAAAAGPGRIIPERCVRLPRRGARQRTCRRGWENGRGEGAEQPKPADVEASAHFHVRANPAQHPATRARQGARARTRLARRQPVAGSGSAPATVLGTCAAARTPLAFCGAGS